MNKEQLLLAGKIAKDTFFLLPFVKIQEPGELALDYILWPHLIDFFRTLNTYKLLDVLKAKQIGLCLAPSTLVLTSDLRWVTLSSIQEGDMLVSVDEFPEIGRGKRRKFRKSEVLAKSEAELPAFLIKTTKGNIIATEEHRFLVDAPGGFEYKWRSINRAGRADGRLRPGYKIRMVARIWGNSTYEDGWFGGMIDGEGCLRGGEKRSGCELVVAQLPGVVIDRGEEYLSRYSYYRKTQELTKTSFPNGRKVDRLEVYRLPDLFEIIGKCRPSRFVNHSSWWEGKAISGGAYGEIISIESLGARKMIDIMTSTGTFIANGFVSHNSWALAIHALRRIMSVPGSNVLELSKSEKASRALLDKTKVVYRNLPEDMKIFTLEPNNLEEFGFKELGSKITSYAAAETSGLGETSDLVIHDEADFHDTFKVNLGHTGATVADSPNRQLIIASTVDKERADTYFKEHFKQSMQGLNDFKALFFGYDVRPDRDDEWYQARLREYKDTPWVVEGNWPRTVDEALSPLSATSCFDREVLNSLWYTLSEGHEVKQGYIHILSKWRPGVDYSAGIDVGEGVGLDYSVLVIEGRYGLQKEVVAVIYTNLVGTAEFAFDAFTLCQEYKDPVLAVDNIGIGRAVIDKLNELGYSNLYYQETERNKTGIKKAGWGLSRPNKRELIVKLVESINDGSLITRFKPMILELMEHQWIKGYPEPTGKTHGDTVIALALADRMMEEVGNLQEASMFVGGQRIW